MTIAREVDLREFYFWGGARAVADLVRPEEFLVIEEYMEECGCVWTDTEVNDFFWFDDEVIADLLGYDCFDDMWEERYLKNEI